MPVKIFFFILILLTVCICVQGEEVIHPASQVLKQEENTIRNSREADDFKFILTFSKDETYVGEPVVLTGTWYIGRKFRDVRLKLPFLYDMRFSFFTPQDSREPAKSFMLPLEGEEIQGEIGKGRLNDREYDTVSFRKIMVPVRAGNFTLRDGIVYCSARAEKQKNKKVPSSNFPDDDFPVSDPWSVYNAVVVNSNKPFIKVHKIPVKGRHPNFAGHIGKHKLETSASHVEVKVGDPIALTVKLTGPGYFDPAEMPPLETQAGLTGSFRIHEQGRKENIIGNSILFTRKIIPESTDVREIPALELHYFDTSSGKFSVARSEPIPISVTEPRMVTYRDAEGSSGILIREKDLEISDKGLSLNYEDISVIESSKMNPVSVFNEGLWPFLIICPPLLFVLAGAYRAFGKKNTRKGKKRTSGSLYDRLNIALNSDDINAGNRFETILHFIREYLCEILELPSGGAITFIDVRQRLESAGTGQKTIENLEELFKICDAEKYAGAEKDADSSKAFKKAMDIAKKIEKELG